MMFFIYNWQVMLQWFPGHMAKAFNQIKERASVADLFIVVLDARAPLSTYNEDFDQIAPHKPRLFIISKIDLADKKKIVDIIPRFNNKNDDVVLVNLNQKQAASKIFKKLKKLLQSKKELEQKKGLVKPRLCAIVIGVPNSGKSTLINLLSGGAKAQVGNKPGVTRAQQLVNAGGIRLLDTPGILWPKFTDDLLAVKLAIIGSIKMEILPLNDVFQAGYQLLSAFYPQFITALGLVPHNKENDIYSNLVTLCENKKFLLKGKQHDLQKGRIFFINYLQNLRGVTYD